MKTSSKRALGIAALLAMILGLFVWFHLPGPSDQAQILAQMESARAAAQQQNVGGIMKVISASYHGSTPYDSNVDELHFFLMHLAGQGSEIGQGLGAGQGNGAIQVILSLPGVQVSGDTAISTAQLSIRSANTGQTLYASPITLDWKKENGTKWLIFPAKVWRIVGSQFNVPGGSSGLL
jgi:hypothetical protein